MRIDYFISLTDHLRVIKEVQQSFECRLIFRRFQTSKHEAGFVLVTEPFNTAAQLYTNGEFCQMWISKYEIPQSPCDWGFTDRSQDELLVIENGRETTSVVEMSRLREFARHSKMKPIFRALRNKIEGVCTHAGMQGSHGTFYPKMRCDPRLVFKKLKERLHGDSSDEFYMVPISTGRRNGGRDN